MPPHRPTFSESWYRVANLRPRLRSSVHSYRQQFRGQLWHVLADASNNQFFRLNDASYHFVGLLDGRRTVAEAWHLCNDQLGDDAPTQGEAIQLLGQLYASNLIQAELPADAQGMFERYRKRRRREVGGYLMNFLFVRIPLWDPNHLLSRWLPAVSWLFGPVGFALWVILIGAGVFHLVGRGDELLRGAMQILHLDNIILLYLCFAVTKALHELGHGFTCKRFGQKGGGGEVHTIGIMFLVFMPVPYVDASSSWAFRSKWQRAAVGAAGMYVELAIAAVAAVVWAHAGAGTLTSAIAYNVLFIASVSTILFNGNPLLRFDGYYILSDVLEIPNLTKRSKDYVYYLVKRYVYRVPRPVSPASSTGERIWLAIYFVASTVYRVFICIAIALFIASFFFIVGLVLLLGVALTWILIPLGKWVKYLATNPELNRVRGRAVVSSVVGVGAIIAGLSLIPVPDRARAEGVVEPVRLASVYMPEEGFIERIVSREAPAAPGEALVEARNRELEAELAEQRAVRRVTALRLREAMKEEQAVAEVLAEQVQVIDERIARLEARLGALRVTAPLAGTWVPAAEQELEGAWVGRGQALGLVVDESRLVLRVAADQWHGPRLGPDVELGQRVEVRVRGRPDIDFTGRIVRIAPAGQTELPSAALGYEVGGRVPTRPDAQGRPQAAAPVFEVFIVPEYNDQAPVPLKPGQRVVTRITMEPMPLAAQAWRAVLQTVQRLR